MEKTFHFSYSDVFRQCINVLNELDISIEYHNEQDGVIQALKQGSFLSWGEYIEIRVSKLGPSSAKVNVKSSSKAQLIDWGTNSANERDIIEALLQKLR